MSYLVATTNEKGVLTLDFGIYHTIGAIPFKKAHYNSNYMVKAHLMDDHILVWGQDIRTFDVITPDGDSSKGLKIQEINGVTPTDLNHLFELINSIM